MILDANRHVLDAFKLEELPAHVFGHHVGEVRRTEIGGEVQNHHKVLILDRYGFHEPEFQDRAVELWVQHAVQSCQDRVTVGDVTDAV